MAVVEEHAYSERSATDWLDRLKVSWRHAAHQPSYTLENRKTAIEGAQQSDMTARKNKPKHISYRASLASTPSQDQAPNKYCRKISTQRFSQPTERSIDVIVSCKCGEVNHGLDLMLLLLLLLWLAIWTMDSIHNQRECSRVFARVCSPSLFFFDFYFQLGKR